MESAKGRVNMAEKKTYKPPKNKTIQQPFKDLRELLDRKRQQRELEEQGEGHKSSNDPPPDPPSILRDSLRGDEPSTTQQKSNFKSNYGTRGRGSFRRGTNHNFEREHLSDRFQKRNLFSYNIKVEFSTGTGNRKCTVVNEEVNDNSKDTGKTNSYSRSNFRGMRRGRGTYRGQCFYRGQNKRYSKNTVISNNSKTDNQKNDISTKEVTVYTEENWDDVKITSGHSVTTNENKLNVEDEYQKVKEEEKIYDNKNLSQEKNSFQGIINDDLEQKNEKENIEFKLNNTISKENDKIVLNKTISVDNIKKKLSDNTSEVKLTPVEIDKSNTKKTKENVQTKQKDQDNVISKSNNKVPDEAQYTE